MEPKIQYQTLIVKYVFYCKLANGAKPATVVGVFA